MFVKVCGTTCEDDALLAVAMGADAVGFVFAPSPRQIAPQIAGDIVKRLPPEIVAVGVFQDEPPERVLRIAHAAGLRGVQLHGREPVETARWLSARLPMVIQAFPAGDARVGRARDYQAHVVLLDAPHPGSGQVFDWSLAAEVPAGQRLMIAGGLTADQRGRRDRPGPALGRGRRVGRRARAGPQGPDQDAGVHRGGAAPPAPSSSSLSLRRTREPVRLRRASRERRWRRAERVSRETDGGGRAGRAPSGMGDPGPSGRFGAFGGRYIPESLVPACQELEAAFRAAWSDQEFRVPLRRPAPGLRRPAHPRHRMPPALRRARGPGAAQAGRPDPHRLAQDQQRPRPGPAHRRRWASRAWWPRPAPASTAWPRRPRRRCSVWSAWSTWGRSTPSGRSSTSSACGCSAPRSGPSPRAAGRSRTPSTRRSATGWPRVADHPLLPGLGDGTAPLSLDGAGVPAGHRRGGPRAMPGCARWPRPRPGGGLRRRRLERGRHLRRLRRPAGPAGRGGGGRRIGHRPGRARRAARHALLPAAGRVGTDPRGRVHLGRARLSRHRPRALLPLRRRSGLLPHGHRRRGAGRLAAAVPHRGHHPRPRTGPRPGLAGPGGALRGRGPGARPC